jgi:predicted nuclease of predicted toxin-antitoxin system
MHLVVDMNLSPRWVVWLASHGVQAAHWSAMGALDAPDEVVLAAVRAAGACLLTCDLDFGRIVALAGVAGPSVIQLHAGDVSPESAGPSVLACLGEAAESLRRGALVSIEPDGTRARVLPVFR